MKMILTSLLAALVILGTASCKSGATVGTVTSNYDLLSATREYNAYLEATIKAIDLQPDDRSRREFVESIKPSVSMEVSKWKKQADGELSAGTYIKTTSTQEYKAEMEKMKNLAPLLVNRLTKHSQ